MHRFLTKNSNNNQTSLTSLILGDIFLDEIRCPQFFQHDLLITITIILSSK